MTNNVPTSEDLREQIIAKLALERTLHDQLVLSNYEDVQSDWQFVVEDLVALVKESQQQLLERLMEQAEDYYIIDEGGYDAVSVPEVAVPLSAIQGELDSLKGVK